MEKMTNEEVQKEYCSLIAKANQEDPIGSASTHKRYLLVETPLPWAVQVEDSAHFPPGVAPLHQICMERGAPVRILGFHSEHYPASEGGRRVFYFEQPAFPCARFEKLEYIVQAERLQELAEALLLDRSRLADFEDCRQQSESSRELFVCTHGNHDRCCGTFGYPIYKAINEQYAPALGGRVRAWRTSHFGGHRHAPTIIDMPEGRYWAQISMDKLDALVLRSGSFSDLARNYRGWGMIGSYGQVAERELFLQNGWAWTGYEKSPVLLQEDGDSAQVRLEYGSVDGTVSGAYEAEVFVSGTVKFGGCGIEWHEAKQYGVRPLARR